MAAEIGMALMFCTPPAMITSLVPLITAWAAKCRACWEDPHWRSMVVPGHLLGQPGGQPARAGDVAGLGPDGVEAAEDDVLDGEGVEVVALDDGLQDVGAEVGRVHGRQAPTPLADRRADGVDDVCLRHGSAPR